MASVPLSSYMAAVAQANEATTSERHAVEALTRVNAMLRRIRTIADDHQGCECSAALMILEVLDRG